MNNTMVEKQKGVNELTLEELRKIYANMTYAINYHMSVLGSYPRELLVHPKLHEKLNELDGGNIATMLSISCVPVIRSIDLLETEFRICYSIPEYKI